MLYLCCSSAELKIKKYSVYKGCAVGAVLMFKKMPIYMPRVRARVRQNQTAALLGYGQKKRPQGGQL